MSVIILTTGAPGTGKSYSRVKWLLKDYLLNNTGIYITNIPLKRDEIAGFLSNRTGKDVEHYLSRMHVIPPEELASWMDYTDSHIKKEQLKDFRPVDYLNNFDLTNAHIAIDEFHLYFNKTCSTIVKKKWNDWFAEIRKTGCTFEAITQDMGLFPREFTGKIGKRIDLLPYADIRDPLLSITMYDWYELRAGYTGIVEQKVCQTEYVKGTSFTGGVKWKKNHSEVFTISSEYYRFYNSYQRNDNQTEGKTVPPHERYKKKIIFWFIRRNFFSIFKRLAIVAVFCWLTFGGGLLWGIRGLTAGLQKMTVANTVTPGSGKSPSPPSPAKPEPFKQVDSLNRINRQAAMYDGAGGQLPPPAPPPEDLSQYKPSMFFENEVWLRNGVRISVGYQFTEGQYNEKKVDEISFEERYYKLDDGTVIRMF